jgi:site-specific recombinase XerD
MPKLSDKTERELPDDLSVLLRDFERSLRAERKSPKTILAYMSTGEAFRKFLHHNHLPTDVTEIQRDHVERYINSLVDRGLKDTTVSSHYRCLQQLFRYLEEDDVIERSPMAKMRPPKMGEVLVPTLSNAEVKALLNACKGSDFESRRDLAIIGLFIDSGLRLSELTSLQHNAIDLDNGVAVVTGKGNKMRLGRFSGTTGRYLTRYLRARNERKDADHPALWLGATGRGPLTSVGVARVIARRGKEAGLDIHPHMLRHTFAHHYRLNGGDEGSLMTLGGWNSRSMLDRYGKSVAAERAGEAHTRFSPIDNLDAPNGGR